MRIDLGLILSLIIQYIIFIYYADVLFSPKTYGLRRYLIPAVGYLLHLIICIWGNIYINVTVFAVANFLSLMLCYDIKLKNALFQSVLLTCMESLSEVIIVLTGWLNVTVFDNALDFSKASSLILTVASNMIYLHFIMTIIHIIKYKSMTNSSPSFILIAAPVLSMVILMLILSLNLVSYTLAFICIILIIINLII